MKSIKSVLVVAIVSILISGCSEPKIDASSDESMKASVQKVREALPDSKREDFDEAIKVLAFSNINMKELFIQGATGEGSLKGKVKESLDGKTGEQVIVEATRIKAERRERERQQAIEEIRELEIKRTELEVARDELKKFQVIRSRFYFEKQKFVSKQPIIELTVKNGTEQAVSRAYFEGTIASPDRSVPWYKDNFSYSISGGIEPEEEATWHLAPNMFSDWGKVDAPVDAIFTVTVEQLDGADGESIFSTRKFSERDLERLNELKKKYSIE